jgi:hypothetical protein
LEFGAAGTGIGIAAERDRTVGRELHDVRLAHIVGDVVTGRVRRQ